MNFCIKTLNPEKEEYELQIAVGGGVCVFRNSLMILPRFQERGKSAYMH